MNEAFADSFFYIALLNPTDRFHVPAVSAATNMAATNMTRRHITTSWVLTEVADALSGPNVRQLTCRFLRRLAIDTNTLIVPADSQWYDRGLTLYGDRPDKSWSLTDCISFAVMKEYGLTDALTGDHHFTQAGFRVLLQLK